MIRIQGVSLWSWLTMVRNIRNRARAKEWKEDLALRHRGTLKRKPHHGRLGWKGWWGLTYSPCARPPIRISIVVLVHTCMV